MPGDGSLRLSSLGASGCSSAEVAAYLSCTDSFDTCIQNAGISLSPTAFLTMDAAQYKAYAQCYCLDGLACTSTITCQASGHHSPDPSPSPGEVYSILLCLLQN
jgi:hypothetical protein